MEPYKTRRNFIKTAFRYMAGFYVGSLFCIRGLFEPPEISAASGVDVAARCTPCRPCSPACAPTPGPSCAPCSPTCSPSCAPCTPTCAPCNPTCNPCPPHCGPSCSPYCSPYCNPTCPPGGACVMIQVDIPLTEIQRALKARGYYNGPVSGVWNKETWAAIVEFKREHGLTPDGIVDAATWELLKI